MAGYSGTPLARKLGIKEGFRVSPEGGAGGLPRPDRTASRQTCES